MEGAIEGRKRRGSWIEERREQSRKSFTELCRQAQDQGS